MLALVLIVVPALLGVALLIIEFQALFVREETKWK